MKDFFDGLIPIIQKAVITDFQDIKKQVGGEKIYAAALVTDSDCITLGLWVNTIEQMMLDMDAKWMPDEWAYDTSVAGGTADVSKLLFGKSRAIYKEANGAVADEVYEEFYNLFIETVTTAFRNLIQANAFGLAPRRHRIFSLHD